MNIQDLIKALQSYGVDRPIAIRVGHGGGGYSDHEIIIGRFFPDANEVRLMAGEQVKDTVEAAKEAQ